MEFINDEEYLISGSKALMEYIKSKEKVYKLNEGEKNKVYCKNT